MNEEIDLKKILLDMTEVIIKICNENNINYFMIGGTMIGAVRHKGFIPWDDDIDLGMMRKDYEKFISIASKELPSTYSLHHYSTDKSVTDQFCKITNLQYMIKEKKGEQGKAQVENNIFIDIFPYDNYPDNIFEKLYLKVKIRQLIFKKNFLRLGITYKNGYYGKNIIKKIIVNILRKKEYDFTKVLKKFDIVAKTFENEIDSRYIINFQSCEPNIIYKKEKLERKKLLKLKEYSFENIKLKGFEDYDYFLKLRFGDYMKLPPKSEQVSKHIQTIRKVR